MKGIFDRIGFFIENSIDLESPPEIVSFGSGSIESRGLFPSQVGFVIDWGSYGGLSSDWLSGHDGDLYLWGRHYLR